MILIFGRANQPPRVINGVTHIHWKDGLFGWWRADNKFGFGLSTEYFKQRYTHIFMVRPCKYQGVALEVLHEPEQEQPVKGMYDVQ